MNSSERTLDLDASFESSEIDQTLDAHMSISVSEDHLNLTLTNEIHDGDEGEMKTEMSLPLYDAEDLCYEILRMIGDAHAQG